MILVNGSLGIGTGWKSDVPSYRPADIVNNIRRWLRGQECQEMVPWYRDFEVRGTFLEARIIQKRCSHLNLAAAQGSITFEPIKERYRTSGCCEKLPDKRLRITELPIGK